MTICGDLNCSLCCHEREVILTHEDINRLLTMGHYEQTFSKSSRHGHNLKELIFIDGDCIFLNKGSCSVYHNRPTSCTIFPFTMVNGDETIDRDCTHSSMFENDQVFISSGREGLQGIIKDIQHTISSSIEREKAKCL